MEASELVACAFGKKVSYSHHLWKWCQVFFEDFKSVPKSSYRAQLSVILTNEDLRTEIMEYLQSKGKFVLAQDVIDCVSQPEMLQHLHCQKPITVWTAWHWMKTMGFHW